MTGEELDALGLILSCSAREGRAVAGMFASSRPLENLSSIGTRVVPNHATKSVMGPARAGVATAPSVEPVSWSNKGDPEC